MVSKEMRSATVYRLIKNFGLSTRGDCTRYELW